MSQLLGACIFLITAFSVSHPFDFLNFAASMKWRGLITHRWSQRVLDIFSQGLDPRAMALSIMIGVGVGVIPLVGVATPIVAFLAISLRLNLPIALFMTYAVSPLHVLLFIPFIFVGEWITGAAHIPLSFDAMKEAFRADFLAAIGDLLQQIGCGLVGWILVGIPVAILLFFMLYGILTKVMEEKTAS